MAKREKQYVRPDNFFVVTGWMAEMLHLNVTEMCVFAIIYGFSQTANQDFTGTQDYIAEWIGASTRSVQRAIDKLIDKGYIIRTQERYNKPIYSAKSLDELTQICIAEECGKVVENTVESVELKNNDDKMSPLKVDDMVTNCHHMTTECRHDDDKMSPDDDKLSSTHNSIIYNINNNITENINNAMQGNASENFQQQEKENVETPEKTKDKKYRYKSYQDIISEYTSDKKLKKRILDFISMRKMLKKSLTNEGLALVLQNLDSVAGNDQEKILVLEQSIANSYADVYPLKKSREQIIKKQQEEKAKDTSLDKYMELVKKYGDCY